MHAYKSIMPKVEENLENYGVKKDSWKYFGIYQYYLKKCVIFQNFVNGELDTFKKAACFMSTLIERPIIKDLDQNDKIALDMSLSLIENPIWYQGPNHDQPVELEKIKVEELKKDPSWDQFYNRMLEQIQVNRMLKKKRPIYYRNMPVIDMNVTADTFELLHHIAVNTMKENKDLPKINCKK